jgi:hypothetical protein
MRQDRPELRRQHPLIDLHDYGHTRSMTKLSSYVKVNLRQSLRPKWCILHHITSWVHGGTTDLDNLGLVCDRETPPPALRRVEHALCDGVIEWIPPA